MFVVHPEWNGRSLLHFIASWHLFIHSLCVTILCIIYRFGAFFTKRTQIHQRFMCTFLADSSSCEILCKPNEKWTSVPVHISNFTFDCAVCGVTQFPISFVCSNSVVFSLLLMLLLFLFARISFSNTKFVFMIIMSEMCAQIANKKMHDIVVCVYAQLHERWKINAPSNSCS